MDASLETLVTAAYVFACSPSIPCSGPRGKATDQELIALAVAQAITGLVSNSNSSSLLAAGVLGERYASGLAGRVGCPSLRAAGGLCDSL